MFDEMLPLLRRLWTEESVTHEGEHYQLDDVTIRPQPVQAPLEVWLGGQSPVELRRVGRLGDGWLPSFCTVDDVRSGWKEVNETAATHDREIDGGHLGVLIAYATGPLPDEISAFVAQRRPGVPTSDIIPTSHAELRERLEAFIEVGATKFVLTAMAEPDDWQTELGELSNAVMELQEK